MDVNNDWLTKITTEKAVKTYVDGIKNEIETTIAAIPIGVAGIADGTIEINKITDNFKNQIFFGYNYKGQYDVDTDTPQLNDNDVNYKLGDYYDISVAGMRNLVIYNIGDNIFYNGWIWQKKNFVFWASDIISQSLSVTSTWNI